MGVHISKLALHTRHFIASRKRNKKLNELKWKDVILFVRLIFARTIATRLVVPRFWGHPVHHLISIGSQIGTLAYAIVNEIFIEAVYLDSWSMRIDRKIKKSMADECKQIAKRSQAANVRRLCLWLCHRTHASTGFNALVSTAFFEYLVDYVRPTIVCIKKNYLESCIIFKNHRYRWESSLSTSSSNEESTFTLSGKIAFEENSVIRGKCIAAAAVSRIFWKLGEFTPYTRMYRKKLVKTLSFTTYSKVIEIGKYLTFL